MKKQSKTAGILGMLVMLCIALALPRVVGLVNWGLGVILAPLWIPAALVVLVCAGVLGKLLYDMVKERLKDEQNRH